MFWKIEQIDGSLIQGWIYSKEHLDQTMEVVAMSDERIVGRAMAQEERSHLQASGHAKSSCGFSLAVAEGIEATQVRLLCITRGRESRTLVIYSPNKKEIGTFISSYQSFLQGEDAEGASLSAQKLDRLHLPALNGVSVLDIGCNEGFFCCHAWLSGAKRVLGVDQSELFIEKARARAVGIFENNGSAKEAGIEFRCGSWWDIPNEQFDIILFLSAIHYEEHPKSYSIFWCPDWLRMGNLSLNVALPQGMVNGGRRFTEV